MRELKYLWFFVFVSFPAAIFLETDNTKEGLARAFFVAGIIGLIKMLLRAISND